MPNLREVPNNCKPLVNEGDMVYVVPGNGACGPNSAAAHLFEDEVYGPQLRRKMNVFFAKHFEKKYQFITPCTPETPFKRRVKNITVEFTNQEDLIHYLTTSDEAMYMWTDSEDLAVIADMYQIHIKIITTKGLDDKNPTVNWVKPDKSLEEYAEIKNVEIREMTLLHENDSHFNLVVAKSSNLATMGSLSHRFNMIPFEENNFHENEPTKECQETLENESLKKKVEDCEKVIKNMSDENLKLKCENENLRGIIDKTDKSVGPHGKSDNNNICKEECRERKKRNEYIEKEYFACEKELKNRIEENEKLKIELKDLKKIMELKQDMKEEEKSENNQSKYNCKICSYKGLGETHLNNHMKLIHGNATIQAPFKCDKCGEEFEIKSYLNNHINIRHKEPTNYEEEFNCMECCCQGNTKFQLDKHKNLTHGNREELSSILELIKCRICDEAFEEKSNLMIHRKLKHKELVKQCKFYEKGLCSRTPESCWWNHGKIQNSTEKTQCYICSKTFQTKREMMGHRKRYHANMIKPCQKFIQGRCPFQNEFCWFNHNEPQKETNYEEMEIENVPVFQKEIEETKSPSLLNKTNIKE